MTQHPSQTIGCVILTLNAEKHLPMCLPPLLNSPLKPKVLVVDSSSDDATVTLAKEMGADTLTIKRSDFSHGTTREMAREHLTTDIVTMHTQDAYMVDEECLAKLVAPLLSGKAAVSYARQIPHKGAAFFEAFPRSFNYPLHSHIRGLNDIDTYGIYTFFCSNSCAAYLNKALTEVGGFPDVLFGEDTATLSKLLRNGCKAAYVAEALVHHSHDYTLLQELKRNFDIGLARKSYEELLACPKTGRTLPDKKRGKIFAKMMLSTLAKEAPQQIPYGIAHLAVKWFGYNLGRRSASAPVWFKRAMSSQPYFFK